jgi:hypothetical protein
MDEELRIYLEGMEGRLLARMSEQFERVLEVTAAIRDDLTMLGGANDTIRRTNENTRDEIRDLARNVGDMQRVLLKHGTRLDRLERGR